MKKILIFIIILLLIITGCNNKVNTDYEKIKELNSNYKLLLEFYILDNQEKNNADDYYSSASLAFKNSQYENVISQCKLSRQYRKSYILNLQTRQSYISNKTENVFISLNKVLENTISLNWYLFEACEYFEGAAQSILVEDYYTANKEIDSMNEKITKHDDLIDKTNLEIINFRKEVSNYINQNI